MTEQMFNQQLIQIYAEIPGQVFQAFGLGLLVYYELKRKHQIEKPKNFLGWIYYLRVEIIFAAVLVPKWADWLPRLIDKF